MKKNIIYVFICFFVSFLTFTGLKISGYCMAVPSAIWGSFSIASEYVINHAGGTIDNSSFVASDINNPFTHSSSFGSAYANSLGANLSSNVSSQEGFDWLNGYGKVDDVDLSKYPSAEAARFLLKLVPDGVDYTTERYQIKRLKAGVISIFYLWDKQTQSMVANTFNNIAIQIDALSQQEIDSILNTASTRFPNTAYHSNHLRNTITDNDSSSSAEGVTFYYNFDFGNRTDLFFYTKPEEFYNTNYIYIVFELDKGLPSSASIIRNSDSDNYPLLDLGNCYLRSLSNTFEDFTINGVTFRSAALNFNLPSGSHSGIYITPSYCNYAFSSLEAIKAYITNHSDEFLPTYGTLVDSQNVGYRVPTLRGQIVGLDDVYPALQAIREGSIAVPIDDGLSVGLTESIEDTIADTIADAIAKGITQVIEDDEPLPEPSPDYTGTAIPEDFPESPIFDPLVDIVKTPFSFFSIFEPIFHVFGASFNFFGVWLCVPVVLIILLIIWALK